MSERIEIPWTWEVIFRAAGSFVASIQDSGGRSVGTLTWHYPCQGPYTLQAQFAFDSGSVVLHGLPPEKPRRFEGSWTFEDQEFYDPVPNTGSLRSFRGDWIDISRWAFDGLVQDFLYRILEAETISRTCTYSAVLCFTDLVSRPAPMAEGGAVGDGDDSMVLEEIEFLAEGGASRSQFYKGWRDMSAAEYYGPDSWEPDPLLRVQAGRFDLFFEATGVLGRGLVMIPVSELRRRMRARQSELVLSSQSACWWAVLERLRVPRDERSKLLVLLVVEGHWGLSFCTERNAGYEDLILSD